MATAEDKEMANAQEEMVQIWGGVLPNQALAAMMMPGMPGKPPHKQGQQATTRTSSRRTHPAAGDPTAHEASSPTGGHDQQPADRARLLAALRCGPEWHPATDDRCQQEMAPDGIQAHHLEAPPCVHDAEGTTQEGHYAAAIAAGEDALPDLESQNATSDPYHLFTDSGGGAAAQDYMKSTEATIRFHALKKLEAQNLERLEAIPWTWMVSGRQDLLWSSIKQHLASHPGTHPQPQSSTELFSTSPAEDVVRLRGLRLLTNASQTVCYANAAFLCLG